MMTLALAHHLLPGSSLHGDPATPISRVHTDTRSLQPHDLFIALQGDKFDAHDFLPAINTRQSETSSCAAVLAQHGLAKYGLTGIEVPDTKVALGQLAHNWRLHLRAKRSIPVIAVTGSNGKTTVTQMIASILRAWHEESTLATQGNFNNDIGVPLTLLRLTDVHQSAVIELGMNHPGEIAQLAAMVLPTVALVNNAQREHQEFMGTVQAVARENASVIDSLPSHGTAVFPADDAYTALWRSLAGDRKTLTFELGVRDQTPKADVSATFSWHEGAWQVVAQTPAGVLRYALQLAGQHNVKNSLAAVACALAAGAPAAAIEAGLSGFLAVKGRSRTSTFSLLDHLVTLVDDTYNANPDSVIAAIDMLMDLPVPRMLILGDMGEVGTQGPAFHREIGQYAQARGIDYFWTMGDLSRHAGGQHFEAAPSLMEALTTELVTKRIPVSSLLVKGSRFMRMERVVEHIEGLAHGA